MKKVIVILLSLSLLSLFVLPCFASSPVDVTFSLNSWVSSIEVVVDGVSYTAGGSGSTVKSVTVPIVPGVVHSITASKTEYGNTSVCGVGIRSNGISYFSSNSSEPTLVSSDYFDSLGLSTAELGTQYFILEGSDEPLDVLGVDDGVYSFISWTSLSIRDIISSPFILPLIGLSVALFFALPWVISKIKSLIKGY